MTLAYGTDRLESARLVLRRIKPDDLPFFTRLHALSDVARLLYPEGRPRSPDETATWLQYIMLFEETVPAGTKSLFHLHRDSDEVAWVLAGEITFQIGDEVSVGGPGTCAFFPRNVPHAWKASSSETGRVLFLYTPAAAGGYVEELLHRSGPMSSEDRSTLRGRYGWEVVGPNPL